MIASELKGVTPGEWKAAYPAGYVIAGDWPSGVTVMIVGGAPKSERMANACLIAQAKRLYAALQESIYWFGPGSAESHGCKYETRGEMLAEAQAALAAARGEEQANG